MKVARWVRPEVLESPPYSAGGGSATIRLDRNESPEELSEGERRTVLDALGAQAWSRYPDPYARELKDCIARRENLPPESVLVGNGSNSLFLALFVALAAPGRRFGLTPPTFGLYAPWIRSVGSAPAPFPLDEALEAPFDVMAEAAERDGELAFVLCRPNNPTGTVFPRAAIVELLGRGALVVVDEAYVEFSGDPLSDLLARYANLLLVRTLSKACALAAVRLGYVLGDPALLAEIQKLLPPFSVNLFARAAALAALRGEAGVRARVSRIVAERERLFALLLDLPGAALLPSHANFLYLRPERPAVDLHRGLAERGVLVRRVGGTSAEALRVTIGRPDENDRFLEAWSEVIA